MNTTANITQYVSSKDGVRIAYEVHGTGYPVILIDGANCSRAFGGGQGGLPALAAVLAEQGVQAIAYDRRGRNESGDNQAFTLQSEIDDIEALIDAVGGKAVLYGISSGAALGVEATLALGPKVVGVISYEVPYVGEVGMAKEHPEKILAKLKNMLAEGKNGELFAFYMTDIIGIPAPMIDGMRQSPLWSYFESVAGSLVYDWTLMSKTGQCIPAEQLKTLSTPLLAVSGNQALPGWDADLMPTISRKLSESALHGSYQELDGQGHEVDPKALAPIITNFVKHLGL